MQKAYINLVRYALAQGMTVSVWDGEEWQVKRSSGFREIIDAVKSVEEATIRIRSAEGDVVASALVSDYGLQPDETVIDWTDNEFMEGWNNQYESLV